MHALYKPGVPFLPAGSFLPSSIICSVSKGRCYSYAYKSLGFQHGARVNWVVYGLETFPSSRVRVPGPCLWWNSQPLAKCQPFLRPLCGSEEHFENRKLSLEQGRPMARRTTITINLHPIILSHTDPGHLAQIPPRTFHLSFCCQFTHLSPSSPLHPSGSASVRTFRLSFLPSLRAHPSALSALHQSCLTELSGWMAALPAR